MEDKVLMYPGADEVELTLLARMLNVLAGRQPKVYVKYTSEMAKNYFPLYEGCTLANTVKFIYYRQDALRQKAMNQQISYFL
mgnify:CR=1 FL=1